MRQQLVPALRHYLQARDTCPLLSGPHLALALHGAVLARADPCSAYLDRAMLLAPSLPEVWYLCGLQDLLEGRRERSWKSWRRCLELSERYLPDIVDRSSGLLGSREMLENVCPDQPALLLAVASRLEARSERSLTRQILLKRALALLDAQVGTKTTEDLHLIACAHRSLGQEAETVRAYQVLLARVPRQITWRHEFAVFLQEKGRFQEAHRELLLVLGVQPNYPLAREMLATVAYEMARKREVE